VAVASAGPAVKLLAAQHNSAPRRCCICMRHTLCRVTTLGKVVHTHMPQQVAVV